MKGAEKLAIAGDTAGAEELANSPLEKAKRDAPGSTTAGIVLHNLAIVQENLGRYREARTPPFRPSRKKPSSYRAAGISRHRMA